jgi:thiol-disulfide isomerase/thioredoxin
MKTVVISSIQKKNLIAVLDIVEAAANLWTESWSAGGDEQCLKTKKYTQSISSGFNEWTAYSINYQHWLIWLVYVKLWNAKEVISVLHSSVLEFLSWASTCVLCKLVMPLVIKNSYAVKNLFIHWKKMKKSSTLDAFFSFSLSLSLSISIHRILASIVGNGNCRWVLSSLLEHKYRLAAAFF